MGPDSTTGTLIVATFAAVIMLGALVISGLYCIAAHLHDLKQSIKSLSDDDDDDDGDWWKKANDRGRN